MKENSIKNERSSIEEDIKIINNFITYFNKNIQNGNKADLTVLGEEINAIEHILSDYKRVLEMNKILLKEIEELKNNKTLVEKILDKGKGFTLQQTQYIWEHYIPVQKIKDIIDRIDYDIEKTKETISKNTNVHGTYRKNNYQIVRLRAMNTKSLDIKKRLQELLESEEK